MLATPPYEFNDGSNLDRIKIQLEGRYIKYSEMETTLDGYYHKNKWNITNETNGFIVDNHAGLYGNREIAKRILENINKIYDYEYTEHVYNDTSENKKLI